MQNIELTNLESHKMRCEDFYGHRPERDGAVLVGILVGKYKIKFKKFVINNLRCILNLRSSNWNTNCICIGFDIQAWLFRTMGAAVRSR